MVSASGLASAPAAARICFGTRYRLRPSSRERRVDDRHGAAVVHLEQVGGGVEVGNGDVATEVDEEAGVGAGVLVDHLVVVAHGEHVERGGRQQAHEQDVGGREVLELVDEEVPVAPLLGRPELAVDEQRLDRRVHLLVEVDHAALAQGRAVGAEQRGEAGDVVALGLDLVGQAQAEPHGGERLEVGRDGVGVGAVAVRRREAVDQAADLALVEHGRRGPPVPRQQPVGEAVEGLDAGVQPLRPRHELVAGLHVVGDRHARRRARSAGRRAGAGAVR